VSNLFWHSSDGRVINLAETPFKSEDEFERYVYTSEGILSEVFVLSRQVKTPSRKDIPDIVGVDNENNVVIIELKNWAVDEDIIPQVLRYAIWAETNPDSIRALWLEAQDAPDDVSFNWDNLSVRIIVMAPEIPASVLRLVNKINYEVDLLEVQRFAAEGHEFILVNKREPDVSTKHRPTRGTPVYDKEFYKQHRNNQSVDTFLAVAERIDDLVADREWPLDKKFTRSRVVYKHGFFNAFGLAWLGSKSFALFFKVPRALAEQLQPDDWEPYRYTHGDKQVQYKVDRVDVPLEKFAPLFEAAYRSIAG
jgi:hypothetical protein